MIEATPNPMTHPTPQHRVKQGLLLAVLMRNPATDGEVPPIYPAESVRSAVPLLEQRGSVNYPMEKTMNIGPLCSRKCAVSRTCLRARAKPIEGQYYLSNRASTNPENRTERCEHFVFIGDAANIRPTRGSEISGSSSS